jgi:hypothetical protein
MRAARHGAAQRRSQCARAPVRPRYSGLGLGRRGGVRCVASPAGPGAGPARGPCRGRRPLQLQRHGPPTPPGRSPTSPRAWPAPPGRAPALPVHHPIAAATLKRRRTARRMTPISNDAREPRGRYAAPQSGTSATGLMGEGAHLSNAALHHERKLGRRVRQRGDILWVEWSRPHARTTVSQRWLAGAHAGARTRSR